jgi:hypothetical protein
MPQPAQRAADLWFRFYGVLVGAARAPPERFSHNALAVSSP